jgi:hypothetical protein
MARKQRDPNKQGRIAQIRATYRMTRGVDSKVGLVSGAWGLGVFAVLLALGFLVDHPVYLGILGAFSGLLAWTIVFGRRAERAAYSKIEGQKGAALAVLQTLKRGWYVTPAVAVTRSQDVVHRAVGAPGVVLVGEGAPGRLGGLMAQERKRLGRVVPDVSVHELVVGDGEGQVALGKLNRTVQKMPRTLRGPQIDETQRRLKAMGTAAVPLPKGPLPKGARLPRGPQMR